MFEFIRETAREVKQFFSNLFTSLVDHFYNDYSSRFQDHEMSLAQRIRSFIVSMVASVPIFGPRLAVRFGDKEMFSPEFIEESEISIKQRFKEILWSTPLIGSLFYRPEAAYESDLPTESPPPHWFKALILRITNAGEFEDENGDLSVKDFFLQNLFFPFVFLRELLLNFLFNFWEDEAQDLSQSLHYAFFASAKLIVVVLIFAIPSALILSKTDIIPPVPDASQFFVPDATEISNSNVEKKAERKKLTAQQWVKRYKDLDRIDADTNLKMLDDLGEKMAIAKILFNTENHRLLGGQFLLDSSIEFVLICIDGEFAVPSEIGENLSHTIQALENQDSEVEALVKLAGFFSQFANGGTSDWPTVENQLEGLIAKYRFDNRQRKQLQKLARISEHSNYFPQPNRIREIASLASADLVAREN